MKISNNGYTVLLQQGITPVLASESAPAVKCLHKLEDLSSTLYIHLKTNL